MACGLAPIRRSPAGASAPSSGAQRAALVEQLLGPVAAQPLLELGQVLRVACARPRAAPGASGRCPRPAGRRPPSGRSSPWACAARSSASAAARRSPPSRARRRWIAPISPTASSSASAMRWCIASGSLALDEERLVAVARRAAPRARRAGCARARWGWRSCSRSGAGSAARRRRVPGSRNLFECQLAASGPVSASPSPTTQQTSRSGLSNAAP